MVPEDVRAVAHDVVGQIIGVECLAVEHLAIVLAVAFWKLLVSVLVNFNCNLSHNCVFLIVLDYPCDQLLRVAASRVF